MKYFLILIFISFLVFSCGKSNEPSKETVTQPLVEDSGKRILFPNDPKVISFFKYDTVHIEDIHGVLTTPSTVAVSITSSGQGKRPTVLFDDPGLEAVYSQFLQHLININTYTINLERVIDLSKHGAASGKEVLQARTELANEEAALTEQEGKLKISGLDPEQLKSPSPEVIWLLCEVPEVQISTIKLGSPCKIKFTAFPDQNFTGKVDGFSSEVDNITRMNKVRVVLPNHSERFRVGLFAQVDFQSDTIKGIAVPLSAVVNVQGKDYVFTKVNDSTFLRKNVLTGFQSEGKAVLLNGLTPGEKVVVTGTIELKGISFGY